MDVPRSLLELVHLTRFIEINMKLRDKMISILAILFSATFVQACNKAQAEVVPTKPAVLTIGLLKSTPNSLYVYSQWSASTVAVPNGPITYPISWVDNGQTRRSATVSVLADTTALARATIGGKDSVVFNLQALYAFNGKTSASVFAIKVVINTDNQVPSIPIIVKVDTL